MFYYFLMNKQQNGSFYKPVKYANQFSLQQMKEKDFSVI